jgi:DNA polymerase III delta prime subunit
METYASSSRFILTCNYPNKVIPALHSRCQGFHIEKIDHTEFTARVATVCVTEGVEVDIDTLDSYVKATYPDLRKCLNLCQMNTIDGALVKPNEGDSATADYKLAVVDLFKQGKILEARKMLCSQVRPEEMDELFRWMYDNLELWGDTQESKDAAILIIAKGLRNIPMVADQEINLAATLVELCQISN